jgi:hypothetical protein
MATLMMGVTSARTTTMKGRVGAFFHRWPTIFSRVFEIGGGPEGLGLQIQSPLHLGCRRLIQQRGTLTQGHVHALPHPLGSTPRGRSNDMALGSPELVSHWEVTETICQNSKNAHCSSQMHFFPPHHQHFCSYHDEASRA